MEKLKKIKTYLQFMDFDWFLSLNDKNDLMESLHPNETYHIYNHAVGDDDLFRENGNYLYFLKRYAYFIHPVAHTYAYCLMPNHFHVLVKIRSEEELTGTFPKFETLEKLLSKQFSNLFSSYTQSFNKVYNRKGSLFIKNFKRKQITDESYFTSIVQYIHRNPVHHGFCNSMDEWYWSSYHTYLNSKETLLRKDETLEWFGGKNEFIKIHSSIKKDHFQLTEDGFY